MTGWDKLVVVSLVAARCLVIVVDELVKRRHQRRAVDRAVDRHPAGALADVVELRRRVERDS
jgi:hypothetical protein